MAVKGAAAPSRISRRSRRRPLYHDRHAPRYRPYEWLKSPPDQPRSPSASWRKVFSSNEETRYLPGGMTLHERRYHESSQGEDRKEIEGSIFSARNIGGGRGSSSRYLETLGPDITHLL